MLERSGRRRLARLLTASDLVAIVIVVIATVVVVAVVLGLHIWGAIQDGREEKAMRPWRRRRRE
jgi:hypothetical protein